MMIRELINQVRWNCRVASANAAGTFSLCGLLLRLRQLYKWEHGLKPWQEPEPDAILAWVAEQEGAWEELEDAAFRPLILNGASFDPQEAQEVNRRLLPEGYAYGAGLGRGLRPTFFLGELAAWRRQEGLTIFVLGPESARDLDGTPALTQGDLIYARKEALAFHLWDHLADPMQQKNEFLRIALGGYGLKREDLLRDPEAREAQFLEFLEAELEAAIHHEIGEAKEESLREALPRILAAFPQTRVEHWARGLKDALADVNDWGRLQYLIRTRNLPSLALMLAWRPGLYPLLLPELEPAFRRVEAHGDWPALDAARKQMLTSLRRTAQGLTSLPAARESTMDSATLSIIEKRYLAPLGL